MLKPDGKTRVPNWTHGWVPRWEGDQWIVELTSEGSARAACAEMQFVTGAPPLDVAPHPGGSGWYVGVAD